MHRITRTDIGLTIEQMKLLTAGKDVYITQKGNKYRMLLVCKKDLPDAVCSMGRSSSGGRRGAK